MYNISDEYKEQIPLAGRIKDTIIEIEDGELTVGQIDMMTVKEFDNLLVGMLSDTTKLVTNKIVYRFKGQLYKTIMKELELEVKGQMSLVDKILHLKNGLRVNGKFEYVDFGNFIVKTTEDVKDKETIKVTAYDNMLKFMIPFDLSKLKVTLPCTIKVFAKALADYCGVELYTENFFNNDILIDEDYFTIQKMTCRDVLEKLAQATLCTIFIKEDKLYFSDINSIDEVLDINVLKTLKLENKFGPVNSFVLGRGDVEDNVYNNDEESINTNGLCEIRFDENEILDNKREQVITNMFNHIKGLEFYPFEAKEVGLGYLEPCDLVKCRDRQKNEYKCLILNLELAITSGMTETISANTPDTTTTEYKYATKEEKANLKTWRLTKKNEGIIEDVIEQTSENSQKLSKHEQTIDSMKDTISSQETKIKTIEGKADTAQSTADGAVSQIKTTNTKLVEVEKTVDGITQSVSAVEEEVETAQSTADSTKNNLATNYYTKTEAENKITQTAESTKSEVSKTYSTKTETANAKTEAINSANASTDNKLKDYSTTTQMNSKITQTAESINKEVSKKVGNNEIISKINQSAETIAISANKLNINGAVSANGNFKVDTSGNMTCKNANVSGKVTATSGTIGGFNITDNYISCTKNNNFGYIGNMSNNSNDFIFVRTGTEGNYKFPFYIRGNGLVHAENMEIAGGNINLQDNGTYESAKVIAKNSKDSSEFSKFGSSGVMVQRRYNGLLDGSYGSNYFGIVRSSPDDYILESITGRIGSDTSFAVYSNGVSTTIYPDRIIVNNEGPAMYGMNEHKYRCKWTGSQLQFWVDVTNVGTLSDKRLKTEIQDIDEDFIKAIEEVEMKQFKVANRNGLISFGILAQDLIDIFEKYNKNPFDYEIVYETQYRTDDDTIYYAINYEQYLILKSKAQEQEIKELQEKDKQKDEIIQDLIKRVELLEKGANK